MAASPEAQAEAAGATADNVDGTLPSVEAAVTGALLTVEVALLTVEVALLTVEVALLLLVGGTAPAVEAAVAAAPLTAGVTPEVGVTATDVTGTAVDGAVTGVTGTAVDGTVTGVTGTARAVGTTGAATVVAAVATGTALVSVPERTEAALLLTASATTCTKEPVSLVSNEMLLSPFEPKSTVWVELTKRTCWLPRVRSMASGVLAKRTVLSDDSGPSRRVLVTCRCSTLDLHLQHSKHFRTHMNANKRKESYKIRRNQREEASKVNGRNKDKPANLYQMAWTCTACD